MNRFARRSLIAGLALSVTIGLLGGGLAYAAPPSVPQGPPVWCYGEVDDQCHLFLGTEQSCMDVAPCFSFASAVRGGVSFESSEVAFCLGADEFGRCQLLVGTAEDCRNVEPCRAINGQLPRAPERAPR